jgi:hypothetical protein
MKPMIRVIPAGGFLYHGVLINAGYRKCSYVFLIERVQFFLREIYIFKTLENC